MRTVHRRACGSGAGYLAKQCVRRSSCLQLEDLIGMSEPVNVPGTS